MTDTPRRGPRPSPERRSAILRAALAQFALRGADASTTRDIAAAAGTTERTLFKHFGSKAGLVQAAIETVSLELMEQAAFARVLDPRPFSRAEFAAWHLAFLADRVDTALGAPDNYRILFAELLRDPDFRQRYAGRWLAEVFAPLAGHLGRLQQAGEIGEGQSPAALAGAFFTLNLGYLVTRFALAPEMEWQSDRNIAAIGAMFLSLADA